MSAPAASQTQPAPLAPAPAPAGGSASAAGGAPTPKLSYIPEILEEHYEELQFLWAMRRTALRSARFTLRELAKLDERMEAHLQGMLAVGEPMRELVEPGLADGDPNIAFAAAFALLRLGAPATTRLVLDHFAVSKEANLDGLREALCHAAPPEVLRDLESLSQSGNAAVAAASLEILTWRAATAPAVERVRSCLTFEAPGARATAWRVLAALGAPADPKEYSAAMRDDDPVVREEAVWAAVWARVPGILTLARRYAAPADPAHLALYRVLAALGTHEDGATLERLARDAKVGPPTTRFALLGSFGHPPHIDFLIDQMASEDPATAVSAGAAFTRMTGADVASKTTGQLPPAEPTGDAEIDAEFAEEVRLPDPARAQSVWLSLSMRFAGAEKICRGEDISRGATSEQLAQFDLASRWEVAARNRFYGIAGPSPMELARFPSR